MGPKASHIPALFSAKEDHLEVLLLQIRLHHLNLQGRQHSVAQFRLPSCPACLPSHCYLIFEHFHLHPELDFQTSITTGSHILALSLQDHHVLHTTMSFPAPEVNEFCHRPLLDPPTPKHLNCTSKEMSTHCPWHKIHQLH